jgi:hypothetical protein
MEQGVAGGEHVEARRWALIVIGVLLRGPLTSACWKAWGRMLSRAEDGRGCATGAADPSSGGT